MKRVFIVSIAFLAFSSVSYAFGNISNGLIGNIHGRDDDNFSDKEGGAKRVRTAAFLETDESIGSNTDDDSVSVTSDSSSEEPYIDELVNDDMKFITGSLILRRTEPLINEQKEVLQDIIFKIYEIADTANTPHPLFVEHYASLISQLALVTNIDARKRCIDELASKYLGFTMALCVGKGD